MCSCVGGNRDEAGRVLIEYASSMLRTRVLRIVSTKTAIIYHTNLIPISLRSLPCTRLLRRHDLIRLARPQMHLQSTLGERATTIRTFLHICISNFFRRRINSFQGRCIDSCASCNRKMSGLLSDDKYPPVLTTSAAAALH